jgi:hypothetical protein
MRTILEHTVDSLELHFWHAMAGTTGLALAWRRRFRSLQPVVIFLAAGTLTFFLGRFAGQLLLALLD